MGKQVYVIMSHDFTLGTRKAFVSEQDARRAAGGGEVIRAVSLGDKGWDRAQQNGKVFALTIDVEDNCDRDDYPSGIQAPFYDGLYTWAYGTEADAVSKADDLNDDDCRVVDVETLTLVMDAGRGFAPVPSRTESPVMAGRMALAVSSEPRGIPPPPSCSISIGL